MKIKVSQVNRDILQLKESRITRHSFSLQILISIHSLRD